MKHKSSLIAAALLAVFAIAFHADVTARAATHLAQPAINSGDSVVIHSIRDLFIKRAYADAPAPAASASPVPVAPEVVVTPNALGDAVGKATDGVNWLSKLLGDNAGIIATILGVLFGLSKAVSTSKAVPIVKWIQALFDMAAGLFLALGGLCSKLAKLVSDLLASDGIAGKQ